MEFFFYAMAKIFRTIIYLLLSLFVVTSSKNLGEEFIGSNFSDLGAISINSSPISTITAVNRQDAGKISSEHATEDELSSLSHEQNVRNKILEDVQDLNIYMNMIAEELANDGVVIVRAVKTNKIVFPRTEEFNNDKEKLATSLAVFSPGTKSSPNVNYLSGMKVAKPPMCKIPDPKSPNSRKTT